MITKRILAWLVSTALATAAYWFLTDIDERDLLKALLFGALVATIGIGINLYQQRSKKRE